MSDCFDRGWEAFLGYDDDYPCNVTYCKFCGESELEWRKIGIMWMLFNRDEKPHKCKKKRKVLR